MSATIKRKHLVLTGLVIALGTAMFVNWYYTKPEAKSVSKAADETTTVSANLGDAMYVNGTAAAAESDWLSEAKLKRTSAHDEAKSALEDVINSSEVPSAVFAATHGDAALHAGLQRYPTSLSQPKFQHQPQ